MNRTEIFNTSAAVSKSTNHTVNLAAQGVCMTKHRTVRNKPSSKLSSINTEAKTRAQLPGADVGDSAKLFAMIKDINIAMMTTAEADGTLHSRPMATQKPDADGSLWFFTGGHSGKVDDIEGERRVNLAYAKPESQRYVSVSGAGTIVRDRAKINELWNPMLKAWFPKGVDDPDIALIRVRIETAEYWDSPSSTLVHLIGFTKAILTGAPYRPDGHGHIEMHRH